MLEIFAPFRQNVLKQLVKKTHSVLKEVVGSNPSRWIFIFYFHCQRVLYKVPSEVEIKVGYTAVMFGADQALEW